ncbi:hypothetical protein LTS08_005402 [Lithohypha guttulata]|uniref:Uncharacterized protein n=1 Tax=Lithohypha guttulata TaxID=1690604 RepID=A0AAN7T9W8_9EURO|nr:hypothetical protein LTR05_001826 [Lithohypha guttulata]KAK5100651.1 hypothetical protein LTS08_005402 [Lithohypha guttulata]
MVSRGFLFINKDSNSPSLSRNTGSEAALASKVNKHVQQQRFWKSSGPRRNWYRAFVRSDSSDTSTPSPSEDSLNEDIFEYSRSPSRDSFEQKLSKSPRRPSTPIRSSSTVSAVQRTPRSVPQDTVIKQESPPRERVNWLDPIFSLASRPGDVADPFNTTVVPITSALRDVLSRHLRWAVSSSITEFAIHEGIRRIFMVVLTDRMHSAAFLAMATAQQRKTAGLVLPHDQSPEHYSYIATKLIREHLEANGDEVDPYAFVDIFRLAMCEWLNGNHTAARIHFAYIARNWSSLRPRDGSERHNVEVISSEDIFLAIDIDEKPLLQLSWEPELPLGPHKIPSSAMKVLERRNKAELSPKPPPPEVGSRLLRLVSPDSDVRTIIESCLNTLHASSHFSQIDYASATTGYNWIVKRRLHATMHRLQSLDITGSSVEEPVRRALVILLLLATSTPARRIGRTDVPRLAAQLRHSMLAARSSVTQCKNGKTSANCGQQPIKKIDPALWLWMSHIGYLAARENDQIFSANSEVIEWFTQQSLQLTLQICGPLVTVDEIRTLLSGYLYFEHVQGHSLGKLVGQISGNHNYNTSIIS